MRSLCGCRVLVAGALVLSLLSLIMARPVLAFRGDPLEDAKARRDVDVDKINQLVRQAEDDAAKLAKWDKLSDAVATLQRALDEVEASKSLTDDRRDTLRRELKRMIQGFDPKTATAPAPPVSRPTGKPIVDDKKAAVDSAKGTIDSAKQALADNADVRRRAGEAQLAQNKLIAEAAIPQAVDYKLPADWLEKSKRRSKVNMTDRERTILRELNTTRTVNFDGQTFDEVIKYLSKSMGVTINVTKSDMELVGVSYETPIKLDMKNVSTRSVLKKMLGDLNLTYIIDGESIEIMAKERAKEKLTTRTYYVGDLISISRASPYPQAQVYAQLAQIQQIQALMVMIQKTYDPESWQSAGGPGSITFDPVTMSFVVRQTAEMHFLMGVGMR